MLEGLLRNSLMGNSSSLSMEDYLNQTWLYVIDAKNEDDEMLFMWGVSDSRMGFIVFRVDQPDDPKRRDLQFQKWFEDKNKAIEYCYEQGKAEKLAKGL
jgi:hypothetical protein